MKAKSRKAVPAPALGVAGTTVQNCNFNTTAHAVKEHTSAAVIALSTAASENAKAIAAIANVIGGSRTTFGPMLVVGNAKD